MAQEYGMSMVEFALLDDATFLECIHTFEPKTDIMRHIDSDGDVEQ
jgi:hypothetical protein